MEPTNLTIEILREIRDEVRGVKNAQERTNAELRELRTETTTRLDHVNERLEHVNERLGDVNEGLEHLNQGLGGVNERLGGVSERLDHMNERLDKHGRAIGKLILETRGLGQRFDNFLLGPHQEEHADIRNRLARLEAKLV
jgi:chromosome segregation ATPase